MPKLSVTDLLPAPFAWIDIPVDHGTMETDEEGVTLAVPDQPYSITKYPVTNAQFAKFIEAGGYSTQAWWTAAGWVLREEAQWMQPRYWQDERFNAAEQPVVGVSWYEAVAFCLWLSDLMGEKIMLPTEAQWQYAAQRDNGRAFPWGEEWDGSRCNNNVDKKGLGKTTPVRQYEGKGDSPFGVVDMAGNVLEWCLTDYGKETNNVNSNAERCVVRGGSWDDVFMVNLRAADRDWFYPDVRYFNGGFRVTRS